MVVRFGIGLELAGCRALQVNRFEIVNSGLVQVKVAE
jgi:hypothetical protein